MITSMERAVERERGRPANGIQWLLICIKPACMCGAIWYYTAAFLAWAMDALGRLTWFTAHRKPHWCWLLSVCGLTPALPQRNMDMHSTPIFQWGAGAGKLPSATDSTYFFLSSLTMCLNLHPPSLPVSRIYFFFGALFLSPSVVTTERGSGMCGRLSKLTCLSERHESTAGRLPKTTTFRSLSQSPC